MARKIIAKNKKAFFDYEIIEKYEAGIVLTGSETKSIRLGRTNLKDSFAKVIKNEIFLLNAHISYLNSTNPHFKPDERQARKLLFHRKQIDKLTGKIARDGLALIPLSLYLNEKNFIKVEIALGKGKAQHDKRETIKKRMADRDAKSAMKKYV